MGPLQLRRFPVNLSPQRQVITGQGLPRPFSFEEWDGRFYITALVEPGLGFEFSRGIYVAKVGASIDRGCTFIGSAMRGSEMFYAFMEGH